MEEHITITGRKAGKFNSRYVPHAVKIFEEIDKKNVHIVTLKSASQVIKTTIGFGFIAKMIDTDPHDMLIMVPSDKERKNYIEVKLKPMLKGCRKVDRKLSEFLVTERKRENSSLYKFAGGVLSILDSNNLKTISVKYLLFDEAADFPPGSISEALERKKSFSKSDWKALIISTQMHLLDEVNHYFDSSEVKYQFQLNCRGCGKHFYPDENSLKYPTQEEYLKHLGREEKLNHFEVKSEYAPFAKRECYLECPHCLTIKREDERVKDILDGKSEWFQIKAVKKEDSEEYIYEVTDEIKEEYETVGFDVNTLAVANVPLSETVGLLIEALDNQKKLERVYRGYLNKIYVPKIKKRVKKNDILLLSNKLGRGIVPKDTYKIYINIDTQKEGYWYTVTAWQYGFICHLIDYGYLQKETENLDNLMRQRYQGEDGKEYSWNRLTIDRLGIPERTMDVDDFIQRKILEEGLKDFIHPTMGRTTDKNGRLFWETTLDKDMTDGGIRKIPLVAMTINTNMAKDGISDLITDSISKAKDPELYKDRKTNLFYITQAAIDDADNRERSISTDVERQLSSEHKTFKIDKRGNVATVKTWEKIHSSIDNHFWDDISASFVCAKKDNVHMAEKPSEDKIREQMELLGIK